MTTKVLRTPIETEEFLINLCRSTYLDGECYAFAEALHEGLGWPMIGLMEGDKVRHVLVVSPEGRYFDARGFVPKDQVGEPFGLSIPYDLRNINHDDLVQDGESEDVRMYAAGRARRIAEMLWHDLPWKDSRIAQIIRFADELEELCRKHQLWIRAPFAATAPVLADHDGGEGGYEIISTSDGTGHTINRYFK